MIEINLGRVTGKPGTPGAPGDPGPPGPPGSYSPESAANTNMGTGPDDLRTNSQNDGRFLQRANNLSDVTNQATARTNLGLGGAAESDVAQSTGQSITDVMSQKAVTDALAGAGGGPTVVQVTGQSTTDVMSQKAVTDELALRANTSTTITAGTGLTGGGDLSADRTLSASYGTTAGTAAQGNDSRLSDSREWAADTVTQNEAETGTDTTRRAWTAQRVRQAIAAWFTGVSGAIGRTILSRGTASDVRTDLGLGSAAVSDVVQVAGQSTTSVMSQKAVTDAISGGGGGDALPSITASITTNGAFNNILECSGIVSALALEAGDVVRVQYAGYNKFHTVEALVDANTVRLNHEHAGNRGNGALRLENKTGAQATVTRMAKWYTAPLGLGQAWVDVMDNPGREEEMTYTNSFGRTMVVVMRGLGTDVAASLTVDGQEGDTMFLPDVANAVVSVTAIVPRGSKYSAVLTNGSMTYWTELR